MPVALSDGRPRYLGQHGNQGVGTIDVLSIDVLSVVVAVPPPINNRLSIEDPTLVSTWARPCVQGMVPSGDWVAWSMRGRLDPYAAGGRADVNTRPGGLSPVAGRA